MSTPFFCSTDAQARKNGRRICSINDDLGRAYTWGTPSNRLFTGRSS
jgi:hypothetical protein